MVTGRYFELLGITPVLGVGLPTRDVADSSPAIVLSESLWERLFNRDPAVVGRTLVADDVPFTIVGVVSSDVRGLSDRAEFWMPFAVHESLVSEGTWNARGSRWHNAAARVRDGSTAIAAEAELKGIAERLQQAFGASNTGYTIRVRAMRDVVLRRARSQVVLLLIAVGVVLLMTCVNVANLLSPDSRRASSNFRCVRPWVPRAAGCCHWPPPTVWCWRCLVRCWLHP